MLDQKTIDYILDTIAAAATSCDITLLDSDEETDDDFFDLIKTYDKKNIFRSYDSGAFRFVFHLSPDIPYVIKMPYWGNPDCEDEIMLYQEAAANHIDVSASFTPLFRIGEIDEMAFYAQPAILYTFTECSCLDGLSPHSLDIADSYLETETALSTEFIANTAEVFGDEYTEALVDFIENWDINDLHDNNIAFMKDGTPVIIDYGGC